MKAVLVIICILISPTSFFSQSYSGSSEPLKVEWKTELQIPKEGAQLTDLIIGGDKLYYSMRGKDGSGIFAQDLNGQVPMPIVENSFIQNLNYINGNLFTMGGCQLIRRSAMATPETEFCLQLQENWTLSAVEGRVAGTTAYGLHWANPGSITHPGRHSDDADLRQFHLGPARSPGDARGRPRGRLSHARGAHRGIEESPRAPGPHGGRGGWSETA